MDIKLLSIDNLELSVRTKNALHRVQIHTLGDLLEQNEESLSSIRNMGAKSITEALEVIAKYTDLATENTKEQSNESDIDVTTERVIKYLEENAITIDALENLSIKAYNYLLFAGFKYLSEFIFMNKTELMDKHKIHPVYAQEIANHCKEYLNTLYSNVNFKDSINQKAHEYSEQTDIKEAQLQYIKANDMTFDEMALSNRSKNSLTKAGYTMLSDIAFLSSQELSDIPQLGATSVVEIQHKVNDYFSAHDKSMNAFVSGDKTAILGDESIKKNILDLYKGIGFKGLSLNDIENRLNLREFLPLDKLKKFIGQLIAENKLVYVDFRCHRVYPSFADYLESCTCINERNKIMIQERLEGKTLDAIGQQYDLTRERVRQVLKKDYQRVINNYKSEYHLAFFDEDYYKYLFETYKFDRKEIAPWLGISDYLINYIELSGVKQGKKELESALEDVANLDAGLRFKIKNYIHRNQLFIDNKWVDKKRSELENVVVQKFCQNNVSFSDFTKIYNDFLVEMDIDYDESLYYTESVERSRKNHLADSRFLLWKQNEQIRFYDIDAHDYTELFDTLSLESYENIEFSTLKLFRMYPEIMQKYDLRDHYDLHNLLRKIVPDGSCNNFKCGRTPNISFGTFDRNKALLEILKANAPISVENLAKLISDEYGYDIGVTMSTYLTPFNCYLKNGYYTFDHKQMSKEKMDILKTHLTEDLYLVEDIRKKYLELFDDAEPDEINSYTLKVMGFSLCYNYALQNYSSLEKYIKHLLTCSDIVDITHIKKQFGTNQSYYAKLNELKKELKIIEFEPDQYITLSKLENGGVTKDDLLNFCDAVYDFAEDNTYFSISSIRQDGFEHELFDFGFSDLFYSSILYADSRFTNTKAYKSMVFYKGSDYISIKSFLYSIIKSYGSIDIYDLMNELSDKHGCSFDEKWDILWKLRSTEIFFDKILERLYINSELYYRELDEVGGA